MPTVCKVWPRKLCILRKVGFFCCLVAEVRKSDVRRIEEEEAQCGAWLLAGGWAEHISVILG